MSKNSRVTKVQVPGEEPKPVAAPEAAAPAPVQAAASETSPPVVQAPEPAAVTSLDIDALRAEIRAEEMGKLHAELASQSKAASTVIAAPAPAAQRAKADYRNMRAADIDPTTLTAPVLTLDGYVCPPAPEAKK